MENKGRYNFIDSVNTSQKYSSSESEQHHPSHAHPTCAVSYGSNRYRRDRSGRSGARRDRRRAGSDRTHSGEYRRRSDRPRLRSERCGLLERFADDCTSSRISTRANGGQENTCRRRCGSPRRRSVGDNDSRFGSRLVGESQSHTFTLLYESCSRIISTSSSDHSRSIDLPSKPSIGARFVSEDIHSAQSSITFSVSSEQTQPRIFSLIPPVATHSARASRKRVQVRSHCGFMEAKRSVK